ncbi:MAG: DUF2059 domain-containing protein [Candidatus Acidiferrum sp.]
MKKLLCSTVLCLSLCAFSAAQQNPADAPASKEDIEKYLQVMHSKEMMTKMVDAMSKPMHEMVHQQYLRDKERLPADFEARVNKIMDDQFKNFPWDEMLEAMVPVYQKHLTKGDVDALVAFYSTPTGQRLIQELPAITAEASQQMMPLLQKNMETMSKLVQDEMATMLKDDAVSKSGQASPQKNK